MKTAREMLREFREGRGITQTHIAKKTGKSRKRISALENGEIAIKADELIEICVKGFEVSPAYFFGIEFPETENADQENPS